MYVDALTPVNCIFTVNIRGVIAPETLHAALRKIQQKHPLLQMQIDDKQTGGPYFILNENIGEIPVRVIERKGEDDWLNESKAEWNKLFDGENEPLARVVWLKDAEVSDILLVLPHCICDGSTLVTLLQELLFLLDQPDLQLTPYKSFSSVKELLTPAFSISQAKILKARMFSLLGKAFFLFKPTSRKVAAGNNYVLHWTLSPEQTIELLEQSKAEGTTVHAMLCIAVMKAFQQVRGVKAHGKVICPVDIRQFVPEIKSDTMFAFAPIVELETDKKTELDFWTRARNLKADLTAKVQELKVEEMLWMSEYFHSVVTRMVKFLKATDGTHDVTLSNMGKLRIKENYHNFEVMAIHSPTVAFPWRNPNTMVACTFKNRMDFTFMSNETFLTEKEAGQIKAEAMNLLFENLKQLSVA